jgi:hypothetical protein
VMHSIEDYRVGDTVQWTKNDSDIQAEEMGEVLGFDEDKGRVRVRFKKGTWKFKPKSLMLTSRGTLMEDDQVVWQSHDSDVPFGTIGA